MPINANKSFWIAEFQLEFETIIYVFAWSMCVAKHKNMNMSYSTVIHREAI